MKKRFNPYRIWAGDSKVWSQVTYSPAPIWQECRQCHRNFNTASMTFVENECEGCLSKAALKEKQA